MLALLILAVPFVVPALGYQTSASQQTNLVVNGDFSEPLEPYWGIVKVEKANPDYPRIYAERGRLVMDLPWNTSGYVYQNISIPRASQVELSLKVWGASVRTYAEITLEDSLGEHAIDRFLVQVLEAWEGRPYPRTYNLTEFAGHLVTLRIYGSGEWLGKPSGQFLFVDDVRIQAATGRQSLIVRHILPELSARLPGQTERVEPGQPIVLVGRLYPSHETTVRIEYTAPDGNSQSRRVVTDLLGNFEDRFSPDRPGIWNATVHWDGDADHDPSSSQPIYFAVCVQSGIFLTRLVVNGVPISNLTFPEVQIKPDETISGEMEFALRDNNQFAAVLIIALDSWEKFRYDIVGAQESVPAEPMDLKVSYFNPPEYEQQATHRDQHLGSFVVPMSYTFPLDTNSSVQYRAPLKPGPYYVVVASGEVNSVDQLIGPKTLLNELWKDASDPRWEHLLPALRDTPSDYNMFAIKIVVAATLTLIVTTVSIQTTSLPVQPAWQLALLISVTGGLIVASITWMVRKLRRQTSPPGKSHFRQEQSVMTLSDS